MRGAVNLRYNLAKTIDSQKIFRFLSIIPIENKQTNKQTNISLPQTKNSGVFQEEVRC